MHPSKKLLSRQFLPTNSSIWICCQRCSPLNEQIFARVARLFKKHKKNRKHHLNYSVKQQPCETSKCLIHIFFFFSFFPPLFFNFSCWSTLKSLMIQARCFSFIFFLFLFFFLKKSFIASIIQKVKCNRDVFPWWILQKKKKTQLKELDEKPIYTPYTHQFQFLVFYSLVHFTIFQSRCHVFLLNSIIWLNFFEFASL